MGESKENLPKRTVDRTPSIDYSIMDGMTPHEAMFANAYIRTGNVSKAVAEVFPDEIDPVTFGKNLLATKRVKKAVSGMMNDIVVRELGSKSAVLAETLRMSTFNPKDVMNEDGTFKTLNELPDEVSRAITSVEWDEFGHPKYKFANKSSYLNLLFKNMNLYKEEEETSRKVNINIINSTIENFDTNALKILAEQGAIIDPTDPVKTRSMSDNDFGDIIDGEVTEVLHGED